MTPRTIQQNKQIKDETREKIISAALHIFAHRGYAATRISDITKAAGISHGLLYYYFKSKEEIFIEIVDIAMTAASGALRSADNLDFPAMQKIEWITREILKYISTDSDSAYYFLIMVQASVTESLPEAVMTIIKPPSVPYQVMQQIIVQGQQEGDIIEGNAEEMNLAYWAAIQGLAIFRIAYRDTYATPEPEILIRMLKKKM